MKRERIVDVHRTCLEILQGGRPHSDLDPQDVIALLQHVYALRSTVRSIKAVASRVDVDES